MTHKKRKSIISECGSAHVQDSFFKVVKNRLKRQKGFMDFKISLLIAVLILLILIVFA